MYNQLYQYFIQHKELDVPGIGTFLLERKPAVYDFPNKKIHPPVYAINLRHPAANVSRQFFTWLAAALHITDREAVIQFNDFSFNLKNQISQGANVSWNGMGTLSKGLAGEIKFTAEKLSSISDLPVKAEKAIRENAEHMVRVGEDEKTSVQMTEMLNQPYAKKNYWWAIALVVGLLSIMFIGWYLSEHGLEIGAVANGKASSIQEGTSTYKMLP